MIDNDVYGGHYHCHNVVLLFLDTFIQGRLAFFVADHQNIDHIACWIYRQLLVFRGHIM